MEDERFKDLLTRVTNFNWEPPFSWDAAFRAAYPSYVVLLAGDRPSDAERTEYEERLREFTRAPGKAHDAYYEYKKRRWEFPRELRRDFPEWHFSDGSRVGQFVGREGSDSIQHDLREVWKLASTKQTDKAKRKLWRMSERFMREAERMLETTGTRYTRERPKGEVYQREAQPLGASVLSQMVKTVEWLQGKLGKLKVCENPKCHGRKYFFKEKNNQTYCHPKCRTKAKAQRKAKLAPKKEPVLSEETRYKMKIAAEKRWAKRKREERRKSSAPPESLPLDADGR